MSNTLSSTAGEGAAGSGQRVPRSEVELMELLSVDDVDREERGGQQASAEEASAERALQQFVLFKCHGDSGTEEEIGLKEWTKVT
jgi:hypothetical protein